MSTISPSASSSRPDQPMIDHHVDRRVDEARRRSVRPVVLWVAAGALLAWLAVTRHTEIAAGGRAVAHGDIGWITVATALGALSLVNLAALEGRAQAVLGVRRSFTHTVRLTAGAHALDLATKSGGMAGALCFGADARRHGQSPARSGAGCVLAEVSTHLGFIVALLIAVPLARGQGHLTSVDVAALAVYVTVTAALLAAMVVATRSPTLLDGLVAIPGNVRRWLARRAPGHLVRVDGTSTSDDLRLAVTEAGRRPRALWPVTVHALAWPLVGTMLLGAACAAVGVHLHAGAVLITYCLATTFSIIGVLPGGIGFAEASMGASLHAFGVGAGQTVAVVALYRMFDLWLPMLAGAAVLRFTTITAATVPLPDPTEDAARCQ